MESALVFQCMSYGLISIFAASVKLLNDKNQKSNLKDSTSSIFGSLFVGTLIFFIYNWLSMDYYLFMLITAIAGYQGVAFISIITKFLSDKIGISLTAL